MEIIAKFEGGESEQHVLRAFEGTQSLEGLARAITLNTHYIITGTVRKRYPFDGSPAVYLLATRAGSFDSIFQFLVDHSSPVITTIFGTVGVGVVSSFVYDLLKLTFNRVIGLDHDPETTELQRQMQRRPGDIEALTDAIEPSIKKAHTIINNGAGTINIINGDNNIVRLNNRSKNYLSETILDSNLLSKNVSVSMLNANTRYGRVFDYELGRTVPIKVVSNSDAGTMSLLAGSLRAYSRRLASLSNLRSSINITFERETTLDGTPKRYIVHSARDTEEEEV